MKLKENGVFLGHHKDKHEDRDIQTVLIKQTNTIPSCLDECGKRGFRFAGLQNG